MFNFSWDFENAVRFGGLRSFFVWSARSDVLPLCEQFVSAVASRHGFGNARNLTLTEDKQEIGCLEGRRPVAETGGARRLRPRQHHGRGLPG